MAVTLRQVERISATLSSGTSTTVTLSTTLLDKDKAFLVFGCRSSSDRPDRNSIQGYISSTTQVVFARDANSTVVVDIIGYVVEFTAGVTVDHFTGTMENDGEVDLTLSNVTDLSKAFHTYSCKIAGGTFSYDDFMATYLWNDGGTLKCRIKNNDTTITGSNYGYAIQVIQYDDCNVYRDSLTTIGATDDSKTDAIGATVDLDQSFLLFNYQSGFSTATPANWGIRGKFNSATELIFDRDNGSEAVADLRWEVVEFTDSVTVQEVLESFAASDGQEDATITEVSATTKAVAFASNQGQCGQSMGMGAYSSNDIVGEVTFTADLTSTTNLQTKRNSTNGTADAAFYVVDFGAAAGTTIDCTTDALTITGLQASISAGTTISCTTDAVTITGLQASISAGTTVECTSHSIAVTGLQASISAGTTMYCTYDQLTITGLQATVSAGTTIDCSLGTVTISGLQADISAGTTVGCSLETVTITGLQADIESGATVSCTTGTVTISGLQASISAGTTVSCTTGTVTITGLQATVSQEVTIDCTTGTVAVSGVQASISAGTTVSCTTGEVTITGLQASTTEAVECTTGAVTVSGLQAFITRRHFLVDANGDPVLDANGDLIFFPGPTRTLEFNPGTITITGMMGTVSNTAADVPTSRIMTVDKDDRTYKIVEEDRVFEVVNDNRTLKLTA